MARQLVPFETEVPRLKLVDAETPGFLAELDPDEAEAAGAFVEDALDDEEAQESAGNASKLERLP